MLVLLPTPIGNLLDMSLRGLDTLLNAQIVLCEDTRVAKKLYTLLQSKGLFAKITPTPPDDILESKEFIAFHSHNQQDFIATLQHSFFDKNVIYISDAGMPCICDPGAKLVEFCIQNSVPYEVLPGSSALNVCFASSGIQSNAFYFGGFLPHKQSQRQELLSQLAHFYVPCIFYESPHRLIQSLQDIKKYLPEAYLCVCKEMTKMYEERFFGVAQEILAQLDSKKICGEWVFCIHNTKKDLQNLESLSVGNLSINDITELDIAPKTKAKLLSKLTRKPIKQCYEELLNNQADSKVQR